MCGASGVYEMDGAPAKSEILWGTLLRRAASAAFDGGSPCVGRVESMKWTGPRKIGDFVGKTRLPGAFAPGSLFAAFMGRIGIGY